MATPETFIGLPAPATAARTIAAAEDSSRITAGQTALWLFLGSITMLFAGFTSAIFVRRTAPDWQPLPASTLLWLNTAVLFASSLTFEWVRLWVRQRNWSNVRFWLSATTLLGVAFLAGQIAVWRELVAAGVYVASNPHSSFFYILTGAHAVHLAGGLAALFFVLARTWSGAQPLRSERSLHLCATYWHFLDGLWIFLVLVLFIL